MLKADYEIAIEVRGGEFEKTGSLKLNKVPPALLIDILYQVYADWDNVMEVCVIHFPRLCYGISQRRMTTSLMTAVKLDKPKKQYHGKSNRNKLKEIQANLKPLSKSAISRAVDK